MAQKTAIIIGAGPAGLTAAYELQKRTRIKPVIFEATNKIGGISRTEDFKGNKIDIGGHRFFSKQDRIVEWWLHFLPLQGLPDSDHTTPYAGISQSAVIRSPDPDTTDRVMLVRNRYSRILFNNRLFEYPLSLNWRTLSSLGIIRSNLILSSYLKSRLRPIQPEKSLEDFLVNRFGSRLFNDFFKDYTDKLWGIPCRSILPDWGAQRVKGLSIARTIAHAFRKKFFANGDGDLKKMETSLIEHFLYPKFGPGQLWETVAETIRANGGEIHLDHKVTDIRCSGATVTEVTGQNSVSGAPFHGKGDFFISTMPVKYLIRALGDSVPKKVQTVASGLYYRDMIVVGLLLSGLKLKNITGIKTPNGIIPDSWIYIQDKSIKVSRIQIFNNWNPYMVAKPDTVWMGLEVCCSDKDPIWKSRDGDIAASVVEEMSSINIIDPEAVLDWYVVRQPKAYPAYAGAYQDFGVVKHFTDSLTNLFLIGRNGMHRYNNMDHSMLTAMAAVDNIATGNLSKSNIWDINLDDGYHEKK